MFNLKMTHSRFATFILAMLCTFHSTKLIGQIQHALGFVGMRSARVWVTTHAEEHVAIAVSLPGSKSPERIFNGTTIARQGNSCIIDIEGLEPGNTSLQHRSYGSLEKMPPISSSPWAVVPS